MKKLIVSKISKEFTLGNEEPLALNKVINFIKGKKNKKIKVLNEVSLELNTGEILGIIGKNGSGKSTLLRIIANIYEQDSGKITSNGKIFYLSGFDAGLIPRLTMKENIFLVASILGLNKKEIKNKFKKIVEFSELKEFVNTQVNKFSSGMISRLNFSITIHCIEEKKPEILLLDEVLNTAGDIDFQKKAKEKIDSLLFSGASIIMVSHNLEQLEKYCKRIICIDKGKIIKEGNPKEVIETYKKI